MIKNNFPLNETLGLLYHEYRKNIITKDAFIKSITPCILSIPKRCNNYDEDISQSYYLHILQQFDTIFSRYKPLENCKFSTWFFVVLKRMFFRFIKLANDKITLATDDDYILSDETITDNFYISDVNNIYCDLNNIENIGNFDFLSDFEKQILYLKYGFYYHNLKMENKFLKKIQSKQKVENNIIKRYNNLLSIHRDLKDNFTDSSTYSEKETEEKRTKNYKRKSEKKYASMRIELSNSDLSQILEVSAQYITVTLYKIKKKIINFKKNKKDIIDYD